MDTYEERIVKVETTVKYIEKSVDEIKNNHLHTLNKKINWLIGLFVTFLLSIIVVLVELITK